MGRISRNFRGKAGVGIGKGQDFADVTPKSFIFDVEGTLVDCVPQVLESWTEALSEWNLSLEPDALQRFSGMDPNDMLAEIAPGLASEVRKEAIKYQGKIYRSSFLHKVHAFPHAKQLLQMLHERGHRLALATTCDSSELSHYRKLIDADDDIAVVACGDDVKHGKPDPALLQLALRKLGTASAVAIGDTPYDAIAAKNAGIACLGVLTGGFSERTLRDAGCESVYPDLAGLRADYSVRLAVTSP